MTDRPKIKGNPLLVTVYLLVLCYIVGEFVIPKYPLLYPIHLIGILGLIISLFFFFSGFNIFTSYEENPAPTSPSERLIKTGIFAYTRNPIYLSFVFLHLSMFLVFENVMYFLSALGLAVWLHHWAIKVEEEYLQQNFNEEYDRYKNAVKRWLFF